MALTRHSPILLSFLVALAPAGRLHSQSRALITDDQARTQSISLSPQEIFTHISGSVFIVEVTSRDGTPVAQGSGVAFGSDRIATNKHVVIEGERLVVIQGDKTWTARVLQLARHFDMCLLEVPGLNVTSVPPIRPSGSLVVGERVYAVGAPQGLELTISDGLLSGVRQDQNGPIIQTSAPISPGSSGGGLFDTAGNLIGITTFTLKESQQLNFAVPADNIAGLAQQPQDETAQAWVGAGDEFMGSAGMNDPVLLGLEPMPLDPDAQRIWSQRMEEQMRPVRVKWRKAIHAYRQALSLEPEDALTCVKLGRAYADLGEKIEARNVFQEAVANQHDPSLWLSIGDAYKQMNDSEDAIGAYRKAIELRPKDASLWLALAYAYPLSRKQEITQALSQAEALAAADASTWYGIGLRYESGSEEYKKAEAALQQAVGLDPTNSLYLFALGDLYAVRHDRSKARQVYKKLRIIDPNAADQLLGLIR